MTIARKVRREMTLDEKLMEGDEDLHHVLISSGINCATCYKNENGVDKVGKLAYTLGMICPANEVWIGVPGLNVCMHWRQKKCANG